MPILRKWEFDGAACGIWRVTETAEELRSLLTEKSFTQDFFNFKSPARQLEYLAVRVLLRELLGKECRVLHHESGKPYLENSLCRISISHTKGFVAVIIHPEKEIGIDIEYHSDRVKKVVGRFVSSDEMSLIERKVSEIADNDIVEEFRINMYLLFWSAKETMFKMINSSEVDFLEHLSINSVSFSEHSGNGAVVDAHSKVFNGTMNAYECRTSLKTEMSIEFYLTEEFVCTYSCID